MRLGGVLIGLTLAAAAGGCYRGATVAEKRASLAAYAGGHPATRPRAGDVTGLLVSAPGLADVGSTYDPVRHRLAVHMVMRPGAAGAFGCAVAIDRRGYFATAAHLVGGDPILVVCDDGHGGLRPVPARVVYRGAGDFDFAVLHVAVGLGRAMAWSDGVRVGEDVLGLGPTPGATDAFPPVGFQAFAGRVDGAECVDGPDGRYERITGSLPTHEGDSGGPLYTPAGTLLGIDYRGGTGVLSGEPFEAAVRPDLPWLGRVIERDQRTLATAR